MAEVCDQLFAHPELFPVLIFNDTCGISGVENKDILLGSVAVVAAVVVAAAPVKSSVTDVVTWVTWHESVPLMTSSVVVVYLSSHESLTVCF